MMPYSNIVIFFLEQYLGMLQWNLEDKDKIVSALLVNLKPSAFEGQIPCLPAHLLFMCLRYADHIKNEHQVTVLLEGIIKGIQQVSLLIFSYRHDGYTSHRWHKRMSIILMHSHFGLPMCLGSSTT